MKHQKIEFLRTPYFRCIGTDVVSINEFISIQYDEYEIDCRVTGDGVVKEHKGDYDNPHTYEVVHVSVEVSGIQAFDTENNFVDLSLEEYRKIKIDITNFIIENL